MSTPLSKKTILELNKSKSLSKKSNSAIFESPQNYFTPPSQHIIKTPVTSEEQRDIQIDTLNNRLHELGIKKLSIGNYSEEQVTNILEILNSLISTYINLNEQNAKLKQTQTFFRRRSSKYQTKLIQEQKQHDQFQAQIKDLQRQLMQQNEKYSKKIQLLEVAIEKLQQNNQLQQSKYCNFLKEDLMNNLFESFSDYLQSTKKNENQKSKQKEQKQIQRTEVKSNQQSQESKKKQIQNLNYCIKQKNLFQQQNHNLKDKLSKIQIEVNRWFELKWKDIKPVSFCGNNQQFDYSIFQLSRKFKQSIQQQMISLNPMPSSPELDLKYHEQYEILKKQYERLNKICFKSCHLFDKLLPNCLQEIVKRIEIKQKMEQINEDNEEQDDIEDYLKQVYEKVEQNNQLLTKYNISKEEKVFENFNFETIIMQLNEKYVQVNKITDVNCDFIDLQYKRTQNE